MLTDDMILRERRSRDAALCRAMTVLGSIGDSPSLDAVRRLYAHVSAALEAAIALDAYEQASRAGCGCPVEFEEDPDQDG